MRSRALIAMKNARHAGRFRSLRDVYFALIATAGKPTVATRAATDAVIDALQLPSQVMELRD